MDGTIVYQILSTLFFLASGFGVFFKFSNRFAVIEEKVFRLEVTNNKLETRLDCIDTKLDKMNEAIIRLSVLMEDKKTDAKQ